MLLKYKVQIVALDFIEVYPFFVFLIVNGKLRQKTGNLSVLLHIRKRLCFPFIISLLTPNEAGKRLQSRIFYLSRSESVKRDRLFHIWGHGLPSFFTVSFVDQSAVLLDQPHDITVGLSVLRADNSTKVGQNLGLGNADFCPLFILHSVWLFLIFKTVKIFLAFRIFVYQFGIVLNVVQHFLYLIMKIIFVFTTRYQLNTGAL